jgi:arsenate reductase (thioredoxin)
MSLSPIYSSLQSKIKQFETEYSQIPEERMQILKQLASYVEKNLKAEEPIKLNFICTHNSRRSHISQLWAQAAAAYYGIADVQCYSGGTEATAFNPRAVKAMQDAGFHITKVKDGDNPFYECRFNNSANPVIAFSKTYSDPFNPDKNFAAIMTCSHADEHCPLVIGASARIAITYDDPKEFDGTPLETQKYAERVHQIGREIFYAFSQVKA